MLLLSPYKMVPDRDNSSRLGTAFTVSVEAKHGTTTGISAHDRATTVRALVDPLPPTGT